MINTRIIEIDPRELKLLKMNARFMRHEEFQRLVANIKRDGQLTSAPFAALDPADGKYEVLSGNHRVQAAISAGLQTIPCLSEKGYNPINQIVGYLLSEDPTYITNYNNARSLICKLDRDELLQELVKHYLFS